LKRSIPAGSKALCHPLVGDHNAAPSPNILRAVRAA
jgi:hypothetical protein